MSLEGKVESARSGFVGFDTAVPLTLKSATDYYEKDFRFCVRYVSRTDASRVRNQRKGLGDLSQEERKVILSAGLSLMVVQHVAATGWLPTPQLGIEYGKNAARYCKISGLPNEVTVWLDLEDIPRGTAPVDIKDYANNWFQEVSGAGYTPGVYVGFNVWLSPDELFFDLKTQHYWRAAGNIPDVAHRSYQMFQHVVKDGARSLDKNVIKPDLLGGLPTWLAP